MTPEEQELNYILSIHQRDTSGTLQYRDFFRHMWKKLKARAEADRETLIQTAAMVASVHGVQADVRECVRVAREIIAEVDRPALEAADKEI